MFLVNIITYVLIVYMFTDLTEKEFFSRNTALSLVTILLFCSVYSDLGRANSVIVIGILVCFNYDKNEVINNIIMGLFILIVNAFSIEIIRIIEMLKSGADSVNDSSEYESNIVFIILVSIVTLIIFKALKYVVKKVYKVNIKNVKLNGGHIALLGVLGIICSYSSSKTSSRFIGNGVSVEVYSTVPFIIFLMILIALLMGMYSMIKKQEAYKSKLRETEQLREYITSLENMSSDLRKFRHDYVNIISSLVGYIDDNNMEGLKNHINDNIVPLGDNISEKNIRLDLLRHIKIPEIKGLVASKIIRAQELNIKVYIDIVENIESIDLDIISLCRIVGILLDNAIEEGQVLEEPTLNFGIINKDSGVDIVISNKCRDNVEPIYKLFKEGFSTKGNKRGLGLYIVNKLIDENNNILLDTTVENNEFIQSLSIIKGDI